MTPFWGLWAIYTTLGVIVFLRGLSSPDRVLTMPVLVSWLWLYLYSYMAWDVGMFLNGYYSGYAAALAEGLVLACFVAMLAGWSCGVRRNALRELHQKVRVDRDQIWWSGIAFLLIAAVGTYTFNSQEEIDWRTASNYWYLVFYLQYPGALLCLISQLATEAPAKDHRWYVLGALVTLVMIPHVITARRGPLYPIVVILTVAPSLLKRSPPSRIVVVAGAFGAAAAMAIFLYVRPAVYGVRDQMPRSEFISSQVQMAGAWIVALREIDIHGAFLQRSQTSGDNEFLYHIGAVYTLYETGRYQYGTGYLQLLTHWIPRQWWPDKPALQEGVFPSVYEELSSVMGWQLSNGASTGGIANSFEQFGFFAPLQWLVFGLFMGRCYRRVILNGAVEGVITYVGILCTSHWLIAQGFAAAFVPGCMFIVPAVVAVRLSGRRVRGNDSYACRVER